MHATRRLTLIAAATFATAFLALILNACGGAAATPFQAPAATQAMMEIAPTEAATEAPLEARGAPPGAAEGASAAATSVSGQNPLVAALPQDHLIIKNGEIDLLVENTDAAIDQVTQIAVDNGGYLLSNQAALTNGIKNATITIAVQAAQYETALRRLRQLALQVQRELSTGQDVTGEYVDLDSKLKNLEATADRIRGFLKNAKTVEEALTINQQLADVEGQIEQVKGRMNYLSGRAAFSTITVNLFQKVDATPTPTPTLTPTPTATPTFTPTPPWSLGPTIQKATYTQIGMMQGLIELLTWVVVILGPYLIIGGLIFWGVRAWIVRRKSPAPPAPPASPGS